MELGRRIVSAGSWLFIALLFLSPLAAMISIGPGSESHLLLFLAQTLTVLPSLALFMAGVPEPVARLLGAGLVTICAVCFATQQYWRFASWRRRS